MTKIPSVEEVEEIKAKITDTLTEHDYVSDWVNTGIDLIVESLQAECTAQREAGAREVLLSIQKIVADSRTVEEAHGIGNREATARAQVIADIQALTPPTK